MEPSPADDAPSPGTVSAPEASPAPAPGQDALHLVVVDGSGFIFRAFHALPPMTRPDGTPVNAVFGFTNMLARLMRDHVGTHLAVIFDAGRHTFRNRLYDQYKAQRPEPAPELLPQFPLVREATAAFGVPAVELEDWEADDLIASYARAAVEAGGRITIVSSDKDLMQLIRPGVEMQDPIKQKPIGEAEVRERFGVGPDRVVEVQALMGDSVDNVPGVPGIGPKTAGQLVTEFGDLEGVLAAAPGMKPSKRRDALIAHAEAARLSRELVLLRDDVPLPLPLAALAVQPLERDRLSAYLGAMGFRSTAQRLGLEVLHGAPAVAARAAALAAPAPAPVPPQSAVPYGPYACVSDLAVLSDWIAQARTAGIVAVGLEADSHYALRAAITGVSLAVAPGRACYVPLRHGLAAAIVPAAQGDLLGAGAMPEAAMADTDVPDGFAALGADPDDAAMAGAPGADGAAPDALPLDGPASGEGATGDEAAAPAAIAANTGQPAASAVPLAPDAAPEAPGWPQLDPDAVLAALAPLLADPAVLKVFANAKAACLLLGRAGLPDPAPQDDVGLISYAQDAGAHPHTPDELVRRHLGHALTTLDSVTGTGRARLPFARVAPEAAARYAAEAADATLRLWHALRPQLRGHGALALYEQVERRLVPVLAEMERAGIAVDAVELRRMSADFGARMAVLETEIHALAGRPFALGSPKQLGEILFDEMGLPGGKRTPTGAWGTDAVMLQGLAEQGHALPGRLLEWRQIAKLKSTYADALVTEMDPGTGRVHTRFAMTITSTGRLSSIDPNLQNIPIRTEEGARIRRAFISAPGHVLVSADYSQIELRLLAHVADIPALKEAFTTGQDIHARTASEVFGVPMAQMDAATRRRAKAINFGIIYGISAFGLGRQLGIDPGEARTYIAAYFERYPGIRDYMERTKEEARLRGYVLTPFGRRCWIPGIADRNMAKRAGAERQAINAPLQGGAADVIKRAMVRLPAALAKAGLASRLLLQVHDELLFEAPEAEAADLAVVVKRVMEAAVVLSIPLVAETGQGRSWSEAH